MDSDGGRFVFPAHAPPGEYVINYRWRGYYDCLDTVLLTKPAADIYGRSTSKKLWQRNDHSHFPWRGVWPGKKDGAYTRGSENFTALNPTFHQGMKCEVVPNDKNDIAAFLKICADWNQCEAVNCVPVAAPSSVIFNKTSQVNAPFNWGYPKRCTSKFVAGEAAKMRGKEPLVCYGFKKPTQRPDVGFSYVTSHDPEDAAFFSTAFEQFAIREFVGNDDGVDGGGGGDAASANPVAWRFADRCISCADAKRNAGLSTEQVPHWRLVEQCDACSLS